MFGLFEKKKTGCLHGKTPEQKISFFKSLKGFCATDNMFFREQVMDLLPSERKEFIDWIEEDTKQQKMVLTMVGLIKDLLEEKHKQK